MKQTPSHRWHRFFPAALLLAAALLCACAGGLFSYQGRLTDPEARIPLATGTPRDGTLQEPSLAVRYRYAITEDLLEGGRTPRFLNLSGVALPARGMYYNFNRIDELSVSVHLLNEQGEVLETAPLLTAAFGTPLRPFTFDTRIAMPPGAAAMAFSWDGAFSGWGDEEFPYRFRYSPF